MGETDQGTKAVVNLGELGGGDLAGSLASGPIPRPIEFASGSAAQAAPLLPRNGVCRYVAGFMDSPMLAQHLQSSMANIDEPTALLLQQQHAAAIGVAVELAPIALEPGELKQIDGASGQAWIAEVKSDPAFQALAGQRLVFAHVPVARLTTFQPFMKSLHVPLPEDEDGILQTCLPKQFTTSYNIQLLPGPGGIPRVVFATDDPSSVFTVNAGPNGAQIALAPRGNWVQVVVVEGRLVVRNGYHRIAALAARGYETVPAIVSFASKLTDVIPPGAGWFSASHLLGLARPPLVIDFLNPAICLDIPQPAIKRVFEVRLAVSEIPVAR